MAPREIDLAKHTDIHLKIRPGTNVASANGMMRIIIDEELCDEASIDGSPRDAYNARR